MESITKIHFDICDSTNLQAREFLKENSPEYLLITANAQSAGRGRQGKSFYSPEGTGVYMTFAFCARLPFASVVGVTTAAAAEVCKALESVTGKSLSIKWVNDIYLENKKICGILAETVVKPQSNIVEYIIIGVGVNLTTEDFPEDIRNIAGSLGFENKGIIVDAITDALMKIAQNPKDRSFMDYYRARSMVISKQILCITKDGEKSATALAIDDDGGLVVEYENGEKAVLRSGEISLRFI